MTTAPNGLPTKAATGMNALVAKRKISALTTTVNGSPLPKQTFIKKVLKSFVVPFVNSFSIAKRFPKSMITATVGLLTKMATGMNALVAKQFPRPNTTTWLGL